jgi:hypothetical protein
MDLLAKALAMAMADSSVRSSDALIGLTVAVFFPDPCSLLLCRARESVCPTIPRKSLCDSLFPVDCFVSLEAC